MLIVGELKAKLEGNMKLLAHENSKKALIAVGLAFAIMALPEAAFAQGNGPIFGTADNIVNNILAFLTGGFARVVAIISVVILGFLWMSGRLEMKKALSVIAGIVLIFAAAAIVDGIAGAV